MKIRVALTVFAAAATHVGPAFSADSTAAPAASTNKSTSIATTAAAGDEVVARVNGANISRKDLDVAVQVYIDQMARQGHVISPSQMAALEHAALDQLIGRELLLQEGSKHIPADIDQKVQEQVERSKAQAGGDEQFKIALADKGITPEEYTRRIREGIIIDSHLVFMFATTKKIREYYDKNPAQFKQPELVRAGHILIRCSPDATAGVKREKWAQIDAALALVKGGEKFADVARKVSEDLGSAENGGDLGYFPRGRMVPEFDTVAFSLHTNEISGIITTRFGYHILQVTGHKPAQTIPFEQVKDDIAKYLLKRLQAGVLGEHVADLREAAKVEVLLPAPSPSALKFTSQAASEPQPTPEDKDWDEAVEPFASAKVVAFLQRYPNGSHAIAARQIVEDEHTIDQILASGPGPRFVLPSDSVPPFISRSIGVNTERGRVFMYGASQSAANEFGKTILGQITTPPGGISNPNQIGFDYRPLLPCGDLSVFVIIGKFDNIQGDVSDPLRILYSKQYGVIHIGGKGKVFSIRNGVVGDAIFQTQP